MISMSRAKRHEFIIQKLFFAKIFKVIAISSNRKTPIAMSPCPNNVQLGKLLEKLSLPVIKLLSEFIDEGFP